VATEPMQSDQKLKLCPELRVDTYNSFEDSGRNYRFLNSSKLQHKIYTHDIPNKEIIILIEFKDF